MSAAQILENETVFLFWHGWPSNWFPSPFSVDGLTYGCVEQYMMAEKARLFGDDVRLAQILVAATPKAQKALGRAVTPFDDARWQEVAREVVFRGNLEKYRQTPELRALLLATGSREIAEASPFDRRWGIGRAPSELALDRTSWRGKNWLGEALVRVRAELQSQVTLTRA